MKDDRLISLNATLNALREVIVPAEDIGFGDELTDGYNDGLDMAITVVSNLPSAQPDVPDMNVGDMISRKWLLECIEEGWIKFDTQEDENRFIHLVRDLAPSAQPDHIVDVNKMVVSKTEITTQPEQRWIPVTPETEPKENGEYLVTRESKGLYKYIDIVKKSNVTDKMASDIVAYMPLPKPWEGGQDGSDRQTGGD